MNNKADTVFELDGLKVNSNLEFDKEIFDKIYAKGMSANSDTFGLQFAKKCSEFAGSLFEQRACTLKQASSLLGNALFVLNDNHLAYGLDMYKKDIEQSGDTNSVRDGKLTTQANHDIISGLIQLHSEKNKTSMMKVAVSVLPDFNIPRESRITRPREIRDTNESLKARIDAFEINGLKVNSKLEFDKDKFNKIYAGGISADSQNFGYRFARDCVNFASQLVNKKTHSLEDASTLLGNAIFLLNDDHIAYAIDFYRTNIEEFDHKEFIDFDKKLTLDSRKDILSGIKKSDNFKQKTVINALYEMSEFEPPYSSDANRKADLRNMNTKPKPLNSRIDMAKDGSVRIYNDKDQLHAQGIPAVTLADGTQQWFLEGIETTKGLNDKQVLNNLRDIHVPRIGHKKRT